MTDKRNSNFANDHYSTDLTEGAEIFLWYLIITPPTSVLTLLTFRFIRLPPLFRKRGGNFSLNTEPLEISARFLTQSVNREFIDSDKLRNILSFI
jgi:hypothetical protein